MSPNHRREYAAALTEWRELLHDHRQMCAAQLEGLRAFLDGITDPFARELFRLRYEHGKTWQQIYFICVDKGYYYEECSLRMICRRYITRYNRDEHKQSKRAAAAV